MADEGSNEIQRYGAAAKPTKRVPYTVALSPKQQTAAQIFCVTGLVGIAGWCFQNFLQLRGVVDLTASRIFLAIAAVSICVAWLISTWSRRRMLRLTGALLIVGIFFGIDWWAPKPTPVSAAKISPSQTPPQTSSITQQQIEQAVRNVLPNQSTRQPPAKEVHPRSEDVTTPAVVNVPRVSLSTESGLPLNYFPAGISADMNVHLRAQRLIVTNHNKVDLRNFTMRFQLPEPVTGDIIIDNRPPGIEITWHACKTPLSMMGSEGASVTRNESGVTLATGKKAGSSAGLTPGGEEVCSAAMDDKNRLSSVYRLSISTLPPSTPVYFTIITTNDYSNELFNIAECHTEDGSLSCYGQGQYQYTSNGETKTATVFVPLSFDVSSRSINSLPSSGEHGKWKIAIRSALF